jgi:hypothetical protein
LRHGDRELAQLVVVEQVPHLAAILLAERQHEDRGALGTRQRARLPAGRGLAGRERCDDAFDVCVRVGGLCGHGALHHVS